jgi:acetylornithine deacetylase/succinyl-diaminopimelate desuccinylase-like protein
LATTQVLMDAAVTRARAAKDADLADLLEEIRIPSVSTLPERREDCLRNARWLQARLDRLGFKTELAAPIPDGLPVVVAEWNGRPGKPHLTIYGHYDVQPADPLDEWRSPPFEPEVRDGRIFARGCSDNKGNHMAMLKAVEHLFAAGGPPINLRFLIEGEEEIVGKSLPRYLRDNGSRLKTDAVLVWDGGFDEDGNPALATGLRGLLYLELHASGAAVDLHSGSFGGVAPNPINTLARIIGELKDRNGHITVPGIYDDVEPPSAEELADWKKKDKRYTDAVLKLSGAAALEGEPNFMGLERTGSRPTLDANGFLGGFTGEGEKTVIPARAFAKVSLRLVPNQDPLKVREAIEKHIQSLTTPGVAIDIKVLSSAPPVKCRVDNQPAKALRAAFKEAFGRDTTLVRAGGSIPVSVEFQEAVGAPLVVSGIAQADSAAHSPNERLAVDHYLRGIEAGIRFICNLGD